MSPADTLLLGRFSAGMFGARLALALILVASALLYRVLSPRQMRVVSAVDGALFNAIGVAIVFFAGGIRTPYLLLLPSLPLVIALVFRQEVPELLLSGGVVTVGTTLVVLAEGYSLFDSLVWASMAASAAIFGGVGYGKALKAQRAKEEARVERARREALELLARSEHRRAQSEKLALVGRLASNVVHEINNPLAYIRSNVDFLHNELKLQPHPSQAELEVVLEETRAGLEHIGKIVADLKGFSRMDVEEPAGCSLADVVEDAARLASLKLKHVAWLHVNVPAELPEILAVRRRLMQVVLNLLVNAGEALEEHRAGKGEVRVTGRIEGERVVLLIEDNGPGFPPHVLPRLFEAFFTTKGPDTGTGLGLSISREVVEQFGGSLSADNRPEGGARLRIELPIHRSAAAPDSEAARTPEQDGEVRVNAA
jgi:signal transduction histidine kinase